MLVVFLISKTDETRLKVLILPTAEILSGKNVQAWVSMVLYLKKVNEDQNPGSRLEVAC